MNKLSLIAVAIIAAAPPAWAAQNCSPIGSTTQTGGCTNAVGGSIRQTDSHCKTYSYTCWGAPDGTGTKVENCNTCVTGYKTNTVKKSDTYCNSVSQTICVQDTGGTTTPPTTKCYMAECAADNNNLVAHQTGSQQHMHRDADKLSMRRRVLRHPQRNRQMQPLPPITRQHHIWFVVHGGNQDNRVLLAVGRRRQ